jgi:hypothetical protein
MHPPSATNWPRPGSPTCTSRPTVTGWLMPPAAPAGNTTGAPRPVTTSPFSGAAGLRWPLVALRQAPSPADQAPDASS